MSGKQRKYTILYLPAGKLVEILGAPTLTAGKPTWHIISKNRTDLKLILNRILVRGFPPVFYVHNEMDLPPTSLKSCHFVFQRADINVNKLTEKQNETSAL